MIQDLLNSLVTNYLPMVLAAIPSLLVSLWALWKAHAAKTAAAWDDESVKWVEAVAKAVVAKSATPPAPGA